MGREREGKGPLAQRSVLVTGTMSRDGKAAGPGKRLPGRAPVYTGDPQDDFFQRSLLFSRGKERAKRESNQVLFVGNAFPRRGDSLSTQPKDQGG